jgi:hypothetical protein
MKFKYPTSLLGQHYTKNSIYREFIFDLLKAIVSSSLQNLLP